ncbi:hypothetical protein HON01_04250 [Candidatus Woesearchaeota archaeon]|jgi:hypothetical protein|nr:hypothetical protein [Bacteroidota bacterium]MBT5022012.1 hypothetical protein [Candidatus Woesearchaeota archaeon]MBT4729231.1 hypothetical protein [Bacteroidota bacterium]MBT5992453.1 hypothetical protein [Bacteroidota bacterium]MBT6836804.1 hypothetical protein [Bacteroidota bacterium]
MKKIHNIIAIMIIAFLAVSCSVTTPLTATDNPIGSKRGTVSNTCLFGGSVALQAPGNMKLTSSGLCFNTEKYSIYDAADEGGISRVATVDLKIKNFYLWQEYTLIVTGE